MSEKTSVEIKLWTIRNKQINADLSQPFNFKTTEVALIVYPAIHISFASTRQIKTQLNYIFLYDLRQRYIESRREKNLFILT